MSRRIDPARRCLPVAEWPEGDRRAWTKATGPVDLLDENRSRAAHWRPATLHKNRRGYGRWLTFLIRSGADLGQDLADRVTSDRVQDYLMELNDQLVKPYTVRSRIAELLGVMLALAPDRDWAWLKRKLARLDDCAQAAHETELPPVLATEIAQRCQHELARLEVLGASLPIHGAVTYRNWLMVLTVTLLPLRLKNLAALSLSRHLRWRADGSEIRIDGAETKTGRPIWGPIPKPLHDHLDHYLRVVRPRLLRGKPSDRLWVSWTGDEMSEHAVYLRLTKFTKRMFGLPLNPHLFRRIDGTTISALAPDQIDTARALLGHSSVKTTQEHYVVAEGIAASRRHGKIIAALRRRLPGGRKRRRSGSSSRSSRHPQSGTNRG